MVVWQALDALSHQLELCGIDAGSRVMVIFGDAVDSDRAALVRAAVARSGAQAVEVRSIHDDHAGGATTMLSDIAASADIVITTQSPAEVDLNHDQQLLFLVDCEPHAYPPHANLRRRVYALENGLRDSSTLTLTDRHGTHLRFDLYGSAVTSDHGIVGADQQTANFPAGWVAATPPGTTVNGELVVMPGDTNQTARRVISSPLRLQIVDDHVSVIDGDSPDADVLRALLEYAHEPNAYGIAQICVGMNPGRQRAGAFDDRLLDTHLARLLAGIVTISLGENLLADRPCEHTTTLALPGRNVHIDDLPVVLDGRLQGDFAPDVYEG